MRVGLEVVPAQSHKLNDVSSSLTPATKRVVRIELLRSIGTNTQFNFSLLFLGVYQWLDGLLWEQEVEGSSPSS